MKINFNKVSLLLVLCSSTYATDNHLELSVVQTSGNNNATVVSTKLETKKNLNPIDSIKAELNILYNKNEENTAANKYSLELDYNHMLNENLYAYMGASYIKDELSDYDYRLNIGPGYGYKFLNDNVHTLDVELGLDYAYDNYSVGSNKWYIAGKTELNYSYRIENNIKFTQMLNYLVSMKTAGRYFATSESSVVVKMIENFSMSLSYRLDYANQTENDKLDKKILTSIVYDF